MIVAAEDVRDRILRGLFVRQLSRPAHPSRAIRARPGAAILGVAGGLLVLGLAPVVPPYGLDVVAHLAVEERDAGVGPPRAAETGLGGPGPPARGVGVGPRIAPGRGIAGEPAVQEHEPVRMVLRRAGG